MTATLERETYIAPPISTTVSPQPPLRERLLSLDVFRGLTVAGMLLVNQPGSWGAIYPPLEHAAWNGWTPTDLIFPFFLFIVGITTHLSLGSRRERGARDSDIAIQVLKRGGMIVLVGLFLSGFPFFTWGDVHAANGSVLGDATFWQRVVDRFHHIRYPGVLQRIGVAYVGGALLTMRGSLKRQVAILAALLYGYWFAMTLIPAPGQMVVTNDLPATTLAAWLDRAIIGINHTWASTKTWDPEGPFSTIPAIGTVMLGVFAGRWIATKRPLLERMAGMFAAGSLAMVVGLIWNWSFPINKNLWTSSYVMFTGGMACVAIATCMWLIDLHRITWWTKPFVIFGVNPIAAFVGTGLMSRLIYSIIKVDYGGKRVALETAIYQSVFASWLEPRNASLAFAVCFVALWLFLMWLLYRRKIFIRV